MNNQSRRDFFKLMMGFGAMLPAFPSGIFAAAKINRRLAFSHEDKNAVPTGFRIIDDFGPLLVPGALTVIASRPSIGKTSFLLSLSRRMTALHNKKIAYFSLESSKEDVMKRLLILSSGVQNTRFKQGKLTSDEWNSLAKASEILAKSSIHICDKTSLSPYEIKDLTSKLVPKEGVDVVIIDYLNLLNSRTRLPSRAKDLEVLTRDLKQVSASLNIPIIVAAQLDRSVEFQRDRRPRLCGSKRTMALEKSSDIFCSLYRDSYYDRTLSNKTIELAFLKSRFGDTGTLILGWDPTLGKVFNPVG